MSLVLTINYDQAGNFLFDSALVEFSSPLVTLREITRTGETFDQPFTSSTGFTFDAAKTEFTAGKAQQKDTRPTDATFAATYTTDINGVWGGGVLTGTGTGSPGITGNKLDLSGGSVKFVDYDADLNADSQQTFTGKLKYTADYTGSPASNQCLFFISKADSDSINSIELRHSSGGDIELTVIDSADVEIFSKTFGAFSPTSGVEQEIEIDMDITAGATRCFVDGVQLGTTETATGTRDGDITLLRIGSNVNGTITSDFLVADLIFFSTVQHTANYTPGYSVEETIYLEDLITLPDFVDPFTGAIQGFTAFATTQTGLVRFNVDGQYWNGAAWVASDDSYAQMSDPATINTNIVTLGVVETVTVKGRTTGTNTQQDIDNLTITYDVLGFSTADPTVLQNSSVLADALEGFVETTATKPAGTEIKYTMCIDSQDKYWDGAAWSNSDGTYAQANTAAVVETNKAALNISAGVNFKVKVFLHSDTGVAKPDLTTVTVNYSFFINPVNPPECLVYGFALDMEGSGDSGATIRAFVPGNGGFFHGNNLIFVESETTADATGYWEMSLVETASISKTIRFDITNSSGESQEKETFIDVIIPNQASAAFNDIATT